ncbi:Cell division protein FtsX [Lunatimonas lonarensis]|uniref:Cell division protein FtsX n=1 Tax=Lunatimonas lonarensis TaxID=1232681 RepID=R7ZZD1_9BACT|nr:permease-like cell division protein FtsX [Lunatimonas lonarensis]EON79450.1 Cell division protein FtsX [Lunatimonas lonarensis]
MVKPQRKKTNLGSYKFGSVLFGITLSLFITGLVGLILLQAKALTSLIRENIEIQVFLNKNLSDQEIKKIENIIQSKPYILEKEGEKRFTYISKAQAAEIFTTEIGEDFTQFLNENPLRDTFTFSVEESFQTPELLEDIVREIQLMEGVFEVTYMNDLVESINKNLVKVSMFLGAFVLILLITVIILINNTIRLALFSQRFLIRSMQLVGATKAFIRRPFLWRAFIFGSFGGILASAMLFALMEYGRQMIEGFNLLYNLEWLLILFGGLVLLGAILSLISTLRAVNKYLNMSLDELY